MAHTKESIAKMLASRRRNQAAKVKGTTIEIPLSAVPDVPPGKAAAKRTPPTVDLNLLAKIIIAVWRQL